ncbi:serine hydrolase domain-containing protein [Pseudoneobacillus rhizosphaerae]|uniref:Penicillin-binding protein 4 n=1 Tax=Pseudoneobacillus rhizosphaerae TaxID=2880968 RepID=A0A9C7G8P5_9BACI|nr:serine hydrolase [Pseudoneobacillus rhizosphaerae]CAG9607783.1 Penicillin-binding protein 4* [Pseudoneobacillus rhizosphaerae]
MNLTNIDKLIEETQFSGAISIKKDHTVIMEAAAGYSNRSDEQLNRIDTRFGIASGCKLFTAVAIAQLVESGKISFDTKMKDCLDVEFPHYDENVTIHHLLTHSSGIADYFDEDIMDDFEELWKHTPMYLLKSLKDFLPLFQNEKMKFKPGEKFHYNNAGFIVLGLIVEQQTGLPFTDYVEKNIFQRCGMKDSGYFSLDQLPKNAALGYIDHEDGTWKVNTYSIPIKGGSDGGAYVTAPDMIRFWEALMSYQLLSEDSTNILLTPHIGVKQDVEYGYGIWINKRNNRIFKYHVMGYDPGVCFHSAVYPELGLKVTIPSNHSSGAFQVLKVIEESLFT